jgi:hypothetical protein
MDGFFKPIWRQEGGSGGKKPDPAEKVPDPNPHPDSLPDPVPDRDCNLQLL